MLSASDQRRCPTSSRLSTSALLAARRLTLTVTNYVCALTCLLFLSMDDFIMKTKIEPYFVIDFRGTYRDQPSSSLPTPPPPLTIFLDDNSLAFQWQALPLSLDLFERSPYKSVGRGQRLGTSRRYDSDGEDDA